MMGQSRVENENKYSKFEFLHQRISDVNERLEEVTDQTNKKFSVVKENVKLSLNLNIDFKDPQANWRRKRENRDLIRKQESRNKKPRSQNIR